MQSTWSSRHLPWSPWRWRPRQRKLVRLRIRLRSYKIGCLDGDSARAYSGDLGHAALTLQRHGLLAFAAPQISRLSRPGAGSSTWRSSSTPTRGASWAGGCRTRFAPTWRLTRSSRRYTTAWWTLATPWSARGSRVPTSLHPLQRALGRDRNRSIRWGRWRFVWQRPGRVHRRAVQDRGDSTRQPLARPGAGGVRNAPLGGLVQQQTNPRADREPASGRGRSGVRSPKRTYGSGRVTQTRWSPEFPARFRSVSVSWWRHRDQAPRFPRLPTGACAMTGPAPVDRPWKSLRAPLRRRTSSRASGLGRQLRTELLQWKGTAGSTGSGHGGPNTEILTPPCPSASIPQDEGTCVNVMSPGTCRPRPAIPGATRSIRFEGAGVR